MGYLERERQAGMRAAEGGRSCDDQRRVSQHELQPQDDIGQYAVCRIPRRDEGLVPGEYSRKICRGQGDE